MTRVKEIALKEMAPLREASQKISAFLHETLVGYLEPLIPLFAPNKILGEYLEDYTREKVTGAEKSFATLEQRYTKVCREAFNLHVKLHPPVPAIRKKLKVYPWEYLHEIDGDPITVTSPVRWVLSYEFPFDHSSLLRSKVTREKPQADEVKQLVVNSLTLWLMMGRQAGVRRILEDLRFSVEEVTSPVSADMPYIVISSALESFRPQDELIQTVTQLSGKSVFEELIDPKALSKIPDPFVERLRQRTA